MALALLIVISFAYAERENILGKQCTAIAISIFALNDCIMFRGKIAKSACSLLTHSWS